MKRNKMCTKQCPYDSAICCTEPECPVDACKYLREYIQELEDTIRDLRRLGKEAYLKPEIKKRTALK